MSTVDKMLIKGIRSFDPENKHVITFFKPLTLIVGPNGAGKTTIIECLKLSCTGELPPNARSGHSFIHDPKVAGETETKGQIKLRFKTAARKDVVCIRSFQLTQKASKMEYKAIESVLQTINPHTGEKVCLSYRCADMDREIPALMGVSKAILENVIFVHQDDANWPLQDPSTLKKKFDDIFSATRYTKALEVIKKLHKDQAQEIKTYKLKLENLETLKDAAFKLRENIGQDQEKTELIKQKIQELERSIQSADSDINNTEITLKELRQLQEKVSTKITERATLFKEKEKQYAALSEENEDTDEELLEWKNKFDERIALLESKIGKLERETKDTEYKSSQLRQSINDFIWEISKLQSEADAHLSLKNERDSMTQELFQEHNLGIFPKTPLSEDISANLNSQIKAWIINLGKALHDKKISNESEVQGAWDSYMTANDKWKDVDAQKQAKLENKNVIVRKIKEKKQALALFETQTSDVNIHHIEERENNLKLEVDRKSNQLSEKEFDSNLRRKENELFSVEKQIKALVREKDMLAADSEERVKLSLKKAELEDHVKKHKRIMDEHRDNIKTILKGRLPSEKDLKKEIHRTLRITKTEFDDMSSKSRESEKEVNIFQAKLKAANDSVSKLQKDMDSRKRFLESKLQSLGVDCFGVDSYVSTLDVAKEKRDIQKSKYNIADGMRQMFDPFERVARAHHICPCCERPFSTEEEDMFVRKQRVKASNSSEHMKVLALESSNADSRFEQLDKLRMVYEEYNKLCKETIFIAEKNSNELTKELEQKSQSLDDVLGVVAQIKADKDFVEAVVDPVETANRLLEEMQNLKEEVDDLEYKLDFRGQGIRSTEEIQLEINSLQKTQDNLRDDMEKLRDDRRDMENDLSNMQIRWHTLREKKLKATNMLRDVQKIEDDLNMLAEEKVQADLDEKHLAESTGPLLREKDRLLCSYNDFKAKFNREYEVQAEQKRSYEMQADAVIKVSAKINEYNESKKGQRLTEIKEKHTILESQLERCDITKEQTFAELVKCKELMQNQGELRRKIEDNLNYRKTKAEVDKLSFEIEAIGDQILKIGGISTFETRLRKLSQDRERLVSEINRYHGTMSVYESNISKHKIDLKQTQYKDIDKRYFNQMIQLKTTEMANKDLDRYYNALDKALMRFHTMKMEEINKIIRDLWMQTYRGQDIDCISIHSDSESSGTRSYSYRVLMQTGDTELEMRGRCSAGQKVLASLIIRLALAETFCLNCGILALDEPTTNLDGPNAESLAAALLRIMEDRRDQENFQLIVITHDERFAHLIGQRQHAERYYRVAKDDHQHSIIESQEIFE